MSVTLKLTFPAGRYHATPWGRHVNEGVPEWPPSPWRLLRGLVAVWKRTCPELPEDQVKRVLTALAGPPRFHLPPHRLAHTRHYMPWEKKGPADRTMVFDTFVAVARRDSVFVHWPNASLTAEDHGALHKLVANMTSFGRAEGWVIVELIDGAATGRLCRPVSELTDDERTPSLERIPVFCPDPATAFADDHYPTHDPAKLRRRQVNPKDFLFDCPRWHLCLDTETIHDKRWPRVPGTMWVDYVAGPAPAPVLKSASRPKRERPTVARFLIDAPVLPLITETVPVAEAFRRAGMGRFRHWCERHADTAGQFIRVNSPESFSSPILSGKTTDGTIRTGHGHAHYLPTVEGVDRRRITHVTVWAPEGFGIEETSALSDLRYVNVGELKLRAQLIGLGKPADFTASLFGPSRIWVSKTPVVGPAHVGRFGRDRYLQKSVRRELRRMVERGRLLHAPIYVESISPPAGSPRGIEFRRHRSRKDKDSDWNRPHGFFRLVFDKPIMGILVLGYSCHFGLGMFTADEAG